MRRHLRALAQFLDDHYAHTFPHFFRERSPYQPAVGDPIPLDFPNLRSLTPMPFTTPPWRLANRLDQTRHIRLAGDWAVQYRVIFDYSLADALAGFISADTVIATCHPNGTVTEFLLPTDVRGRTFPIRPTDLARQRVDINRLIGVAVEAGADIVVLPELCVTERLNCQAILALANNPGEWPSDGRPPSRPARALFGHPDSSSRPSPSTLQNPGRESRCSQCSRLRSPGCRPSRTVENG